MAVYAPNTDLRLLSAPLTFGDGNQLDFASATAQRNYFANLPGRNFTDFTYQRKDNVIRIPDLAENLYQYNYVMYQNFAGKWIYAFITRIEFINQNCTHVYIKTDVFQTWQFDFTFKQCLVVREHTVTDLPYEHTLPENIGSGTPIEVNRQRATSYSLTGDTQPDFDANYRVVFVLSEKISSIPDYNPPMVGGVPSVAYYYAIERANIRDFTALITSDAKADAVLGVYAVPIGGAAFVEIQSTPFIVWSLHDANETSVSFTPEKGYKISNTSIIIKNRKCLCYPYHFYRLWASNGQCVDLQIENFTSIHPITQAETCTIRTTCNPSQDTSLLICPLFYEFNGQPNAQTYAQYGINLNAAITFNDFPEIAFRTDVYENYRALNKNSLAVRMLHTGVSLGSGIYDLSNGIAKQSEPFRVGNKKEFEQSRRNLESANRETASARDSVINSVFDILGGIAKEADLRNIPDRVQGLRSSGVQLMCSSGGVFISEMAIKPEYMKIVDDYFTRYGYRVSDVKTPQFKSRPNHNYLQTDGCDIEGLMPQDDAAELCAMFNAGLTVWHNPATFGNYSPDNSPV